MKKFICTLACVCKCAGTRPRASRSAKTLPPTSTSAKSTAQPDNQHAVHFVPELLLSRFAYCHLVNGYLRLAMTRFVPAILPCFLMALSLCDAFSPPRNLRRRRMSVLMGSYLDNLSPHGDVPPQQGEVKPASYPRRPLEEETNPMMVARHYLDRLNGPPPRDASVAAKRPAAPSTGSYLDRLAEGPPPNDLPFQ